MAWTHKDPRSCFSQTTRILRYVNLDYKVQQFKTVPSYSTLENSDRLIYYYEYDS